MRKRIMLVIAGAILAATGWAMMSFTSYSPVYAFIGGGLCVFVAMIYDGKDQTGATHNKPNIKREIAEDVTRGLS